MKIKNIFFLFLLFMLQPLTQCTANAIDNDFDDSLKQAQEQAAMLAFLNIPTTSINENIIHKIYGPTGLNIATTDLNNIKKTYCYLEFLIKIDKVKNNQSFLTSYASDFKDFLKPDPNNMPLKPTQTLVTSPSWQAIEITAQDIKNSPAWQLFTKTMICDIVDNDKEFIVSAKDVNNQIFIYIPNIEQAYSDDTFTKMRLYEESIQLQALMQYEQKQRYLNQCNDWKNLSPDALLTAVAQFKTTDFYTYTHNAQKTQSKINPKTGKPSLVIIPSPLREQILCYFMLLDIQTTVQDLMDQANARSFIQQASSDLLSPNFLFYTISDLAYFNDLFALQKLRDENITHPISSILAMHNSTDTPAQNNNVTIQAINTQSNTMQATSPDTSTPDPTQLAATIFEQLPTTSIYEDKLDQIYGKTGLNIDSIQLMNIKKTYCYLEFLVKVNKVSNDQRFMHYQQTDFKDFTQPNATKVKMPTNELIASKGWQAIQVTEQDILTSQAWQNFIKSMICDCTDNEATFIVDNGEISHQIFPYIPNIETAYPKKDFTQIRLYEESTRLHTLMQADQKKRYINQCSDWKNFDLAQLDAAMNTFKKTDFYNNTHTQQNPLNQKSSINLVTGKQIISYFLLVAIQENIYDLLTLDNILNVLTRTDATPLSPNFFTYSQADFIYFYDFLTLKNLIEENKKAPEDTTPMIATDTDALQDNVTIQGTLSGFKNIGDKKSWDKLGKKKSWDKAFDPSKNGTNKFFKGFNNKNAMKGLNTINKGLGDATKAMVTGIMQFSNDLATGLIEVSAGFVYLGCSMVAFPGTHINPQAEYARAKANMNKHKAIIATVLMAVICVVMAPIILPLIIVFGTAALAYDKRVSEPAMKAMEVVMSPIMEGMAFLTDAMTTYFIKTSVDLTFCAYSFAKCFDPSINVQQQMNRVRAKLEKNRMMINIIMSVVIVIVITTVFVICTGGAAAPAVVAADTAIVGGAGVGAAAAGTGAAAGVGAAAGGTAAAGAGVAAGGGVAATGAAANVAATTFSMAALFTNVGFIIGQAINIGFGVFDAMAAKSQDEAAAQAAKQEQESIQSLWRFVEDNKVSSVQSQNLFMDELHKKHQAAIANQTFGLNYYNNFLHSSVVMVQNQIAQALAQQQIQMLTPDANGLKLADIGASWGLQTPFTYLYPSQGFISTTLGRPDFPYAQEIAQAPLASEAQGNKKIDLSDKQPAATKLWFNQRAISMLNQPADQPLNVEIRFRILYNLTTAYHVGLYLGGNYHDYKSAAYLQSIQDQNSIDLDEARLAKMFVLKRDDATSAPSVGLYENEGKGWITQQPIDTNMLNTAGIYHMSAQLNKDKLTLGFWSEDNPSAKWTQTITVTPCDQRTFGVIFSGLAIEWGVVKPNQPIVQNKTARVASNGQSEADRQRASKAQWKQIMNPKFGPMTMQSFGRPAILQGQYLYTTQDTGLVDGQGSPQTDYMVFATATDNNVTGLGANPAPADTKETPNVAVSLITGNVYNNAGKIITHTQNVLALYTQNSTAISQDLAQIISQAAQDYQQQLLQFSFGSYELTALSQNAIDAGLFIYTCPTAQPSGQPILDYLIMADIVNGSLGSTVGMPPSSAVQGMISLVTGNVYSKTQAEPIDSGYAVLAQYTKQYGQLPQDIATAIENATNNYNNSINAQAPTKQASIDIVASQTMSLTDVMNALPPSTGGFEFGLSSAAPSKIISTTSSISQLQTVAAGSAGFSF